MKLTPFFLAFAAYAVAEKLDFTLQSYNDIVEDDEGKMRDMVEKAYCALPCLEKAAEQIKCNNYNLAQFVCLSIETLREKVGDCAIKCGIDAETQGKSLV
ncbi:hypothetical protein CDD82_4592 [Ophiocordyceps australis]|uniref:Extracellular membrane protein CFEM domain-containing protein n=1 Tax=Ophiocordyceps australis TaxID=1399860 RepID=A0A2C5YZV7_9HYPO|nr:hypothetical protein CDD82_4592 [Ophiocordyceps australis]